MHMLLLVVSYLFVLLITNLTFHPPDLFLSATVESLEAIFGNGDDVLLFFSFSIFDFPQNPSLFGFQECCLCHFPQLDYGHKVVVGGK